MKAAVREKDKGGGVVHVGPNNNRRLARGAAWAGAGRQRGLRPAEGSAGAPARNVSLCDCLACRLTVSYKDYVIAIENITRETFPTRDGDKYVDLCC